MHKISAIQMTSTSSVSENLKIAEVLIKQSLEHQTNLVVLPEMFPLFGQPADKLTVSEEFGHGPIQDFLAKQSKRHKLWIVGGTIPLKSEQPDKIKAACLVFNDHGEVAGRYDKMHLFDATITDSESYQESATIEPGATITVVDTPMGKLGLAVCYDIRFPELFRCLFNLGAEIFTIPAAFTVKTGQSHWEVLARSRAIENFCYVVGACQSGMHDNGRKTYGHSLIVNPWGEVITTLAEGVGIITAEINLDLLKHIRADIPVKSHQKIFFNSGY